jgi:hypothetical protein
MSGVTNRLILETPPVDPKHLHRFQQWWTNNEQTYEFIMKPIVMTMEKVRVWTRKYTAGRSKELIRIYEEMSSRFHFEDKELEATAFVKVEKKADITPFGPKKPGVPRMVVSFSDEVLVIVAPIVSEAFKHMKLIFNKHTRLYFTPGDSSEDVANYYRVKADECVNPLFIDGDAEKYDAHLKCEIRKEWEHCMDYKTNFDPLYMETRQAGLHLKTPHGFSVTLKEEDKPLESGAGDTNAAGSMTSMGIVDYDEDISRLIKGLTTCGDDIGMVADVPLGKEREFLDKLEANTLALGFKHTFNGSRIPEHFEFCSRLPFPISPSFWVMGAKPGRLISRMGWLIIGPNEPNLRGVVIGLMSDNWFVPILGPLLRKMYTLTDRQKAKFGRKTWEGFHVSKNYDMTQMTLAYFCERYQTNPTEVNEVEAIISSIERLPCVISHDLIYRMIAKDE